MICNFDKFYGNSMITFRDRTAGLLDERKNNRDCAWI